MILQVEKGTQRTVSNSEQSAVAVEELSAQSAALRGIVGELAALVRRG